MKAYLDILTGRSRCIQVFILKPNFVFLGKNIFYHYKYCTFISICSIKLRNLFIQRLYNLGLII